MRKNAQHDNIGVEVELMDVIEGNDGSEELEGWHETGHEERGKYHDLPLVGSRRVLPNILFYSNVFSYPGRPSGQT